MNRVNSREAARTIARRVAEETINLSEKELIRRVHLFSSRFPRREYRNATDYIWRARGEMLAIRERVA